MQHLVDHPDRPLKARGLAKALRVPDQDYTTFRTLIREMLDAGSIALGPGRTLRLPAQTGQVIGTFSATRKGIGFILRPGEADLYVARHHRSGARDGDTVAARLLKPRGRQRGPRAQVTRIVERAPQRWVGRLEQMGRSWFVQMSGRDKKPPIRIENPRAKGAKRGDLVVVEPLPETLDTDHVRGEIVERLGSPDDPQARIMSVVRRFEIPDGFPGPVKQAARRAGSKLSNREMGSREDLRDLLTVTIDPPDAKDFDDAISVETLPGRKMRLGVHIADVAHFVPPGGVIDKEARRRGTSVYFPGFAIPMLPEGLSSDVCSLRPGEPRLTKSVFIDYDQAGKVLAARFANSVIRSGARLTYEQVTQVLGRRSASVPPPVQALLKDARRLARRIRERRLKDGMIVLTLPEVDIQRDEAGRVTGAEPAQTSFANTIIEMFMVEANEAVARELTRRGFQFLRRIHPPPGTEATETIAPLAVLLGHKPPKDLTRKTIRDLIEAAAGRPEEMAVNYLLLRSMSQACYSPSDEGHFALASEEYCHFTSPIRRYPDLTVHRLLDLVIRRNGRPERNKRDEEGVVLSDAEWSALGGETSSAERRAQQAEREADKELLMMLMHDRVGEVFPGVVTGVMSFGIFVQLQPVMAEGLLHVSDFGPDDWVFDRKSATFSGSRTRRLVHVGQSLRVRVVSVDELRQEIDLVPADGGPIGRASGKRERSSGGGRRAQGRRRSRRR